MPPYCCSYRVSHVLPNTPYTRHVPPLYAHTCLQAKRQDAVLVSCMTAVTGSTSTTPADLGYIARPAIRQACFSSPRNHGHSVSLGGCRVDTLMVNDLCNEALVSFCKVDRCCQVYIELLTPVVQQVCAELQQLTHALVYLNAPVHEARHQQIKHTCCIVSVVSMSNPVTFSAFCQVLSLAAAWRCIVAYYARACMSTRFPMYQWGGHSTCTF